MSDQGRGIYCESLSVKWGKRCTFKLHLYTICKAMCSPFADNGQSTVYRQQLKIGNHPLPLGKRGRGRSRDLLAPPSSCRRAVWPFCVSTCSLRLGRALLDCRRCAPDGGPRGWLASASPTPAHCSSQEDRP